MWSSKLPHSLVANVLALALSTRAVPVCPDTPGAVATTWYTGWHAQYLPPENISWDKYSAVSYAFAETTPDVNVVALQDSDQELLPKFVDLAHQHNVAAILTVGGWSGSQYFSSAVDSAENRTAFVQAVLGLVEKYDLDGLDFDWEFPNKQGMGCNLMSPQDTPNFLAFLQELRQTPQGQTISISAASSIVPFASTNGEGLPSPDVSGFANVLNYVAVMDYDIWGPWSPSAGPNAPLDDTCAPPNTQQGSAVSAVKAWTDAGFPAHQILLGVASYGHAYNVTQEAAFNTATPSALDAVDGIFGRQDGPPSFAEGESDQPTGTTPIAAHPMFDRSQQPMGDSWDVNEPPGVDQCGNPTPGGPSGIFNFRGLIERGWLNDQGVAVAGMGFRYDNCSQTPYVYDPQSQTMVSYDDTRSFAAKGQFIRDQGLLGFAMWEAVGDQQDLLLDAIEEGMGIGQQCS